MVVMMMKTTMMKMVNDDVIGQINSQFLLYNYFEVKHSWVFLQMTTRQGGQMSRASVSHTGSLGNLNLVGSNPDPAGLKPWSSQTNDLTIDMCHFLA